MYHETKGGSVEDGYDTYQCICAGDVFLKPLIANSHVASKMWCIGRWVDFSVQSICNMWSLLFIKKVANLNLGGKHEHNKNLCIVDTERGRTGFCGCLNPLESDKYNGEHESRPVFSARKASSVPAAWVPEEVKSEDKWIGHARYFPRSITLGEPCAFIHKDENS